MRTPIDAAEMPMEELVGLLRLQMERGGAAGLTVTGISMLPMLHHLRDRVWLSPLNGEAERGDVLLYRRDSGQYVLHRVLRAPKAGEYVCCGDNCTATETVPRGAVVGRVCAFRRGGRRYEADDMPYRAYVRLWTALYPVRGPILRLRRLLGRLKRALKRH